MNQPRRKSSKKSRRAMITMRTAAALSVCMTFIQLPQFAVASDASRKLKKKEIENEDGSVGAVGDANLLVLGDEVGAIENGTMPACVASSYKLPQQLLDAANGAGFPGPPQLFGLVASIQAGWVPALKLYETPMSVRFTRLIDALDWNCAATYSADWNDALTKADPLIRTPASVTVDSDGSSGLFSDGTETIDLYSTDARFLCAIHGWHAVLTDWVPDAAATLLPVLTGFGLNIGQLGYREDIGTCFEGVEDGGEIAVECLEAIAEDECYSPATMGQIIGRQLAEYARTDGWNQDGKLNKDGTVCEANCRRYGDYTGYEPINIPGIKSQDSKIKRSWMPLLEDDKKGYETRQQHVTPHIGTQAKPAVLTRAEINSRTVPRPDYDYNEEALVVTDRLRETAGSDYTKMMIEFFDNKLDVALAVIGAVAGTLQLGYEQTLNFVLTLTAGDYDATILAWKEKVSHDAVRPTTWIQEEMAELEFTTYAGAYKGVRTIKGKNFESYVRVMPHSEYVSGSACICQALMELTDQWVEYHGGDPTSLQIPLPTFPAGSSRTEPGVTPAKDITKVLDGMQELRDICGQSRLDGGMHFTQSVTASYNLCNGVGIAAADYALALSNGGVY